jgi:hypothetical protein
MTGTYLIDQPGPGHCLSLGQVPADRPLRNVDEL